MIQAKVKEKSNLFRVIYIRHTKKIAVTPGAETFLDAGDLDP